MFFKETSAGFGYGRKVVENADLKVRRTAEATLRGLGVFCVQVTFVVMGTVATSKGESIEYNEG